MFQLWENVCDDIYQNEGVILVAAAGNSDGDSYFYPASYNSVMSVAAVDSKSNRAIFSQYNDQVDIAAPGVSIQSTFKGGIYQTLDGTSMIYVITVRCWSCSASMESLSKPYCSRN